VWSHDNREITVERPQGTQPPNPAGGKTTRGEIAHGKTHPSTTTVNRRSPVKRSESFIFMQTLRNAAHLHATTAARTLPLPGRPHRLGLGLPTVVCVKCLLTKKPWGVVSTTRRSSGVMPRACARVYARVQVSPFFCMHTYIHIHRPVLFVRFRCILQHRAYAA